jgi:EAL domain-containing protein (putative c-di-GMP-specific phosphodiesterase class I)
MDDVGSGHSGLTRLVALKPNIVKLDRALVEGVDRDIARRALVSAAVGFASAAGGTLVAEGIETEAEAKALQELGVRYAQGFWFARPAAASTWERGTNAATPVP